LKRAILALWVALACLALLTLAANLPARYQTIFEDWQVTGSAAAVEPYLSFHLFAHGVLVARYMSQ